MMQQLEKLHHHHLASNELNLPDRGCDRTLQQRPGGLIAQSDSLQEDPLKKETFSPEMLNLVQRLLGLSSVKFDLMSQWFIL